MEFGRQFASSFVGLDTEKFTIDNVQCSTSLWMLKENVTLNNSNNNTTYNNNINQMDRNFMRTNNLFTAVAFSKLFFFNFSCIVSLAPTGAWYAEKPWTKTD